MPEFFRNPNDENSPYGYPLWQSSGMSTFNGQDQSTPQLDWSPVNQYPHAINPLLGQHMEKLKSDPKYARTYQIVTDEQKRKGNDPNNPEYIGKFYSWYESKMAPQMTEGGAVSQYGRNPSYFTRTPAGQNAPSVAPYLDEQGRPTWHRNPTEAADERKWAEGLYTTAAGITMTLTPTEQDRRLEKEKNYRAYLDNGTQAYVGRGSKGSGVFQLEGQKPVYIGKTPQENLQAMQAIVGNLTAPERRWSMPDAIHSTYTASGISPKDEQWMTAAQTGKYPQTSQQGQSSGVPSKGEEWWHPTTADDILLISFAKKVQAGKPTTDITWEEWGAVTRSVGRDLRKLPGFISTALGKMSSYIDSVPEKVKEYMRENERISGPPELSSEPINRFPVVYGGGGVARRWNEPPPGTPPLGTPIPWGDIPKLKVTKKAPSKLKVKKRKKK